LRVVHVTSVHPDKDVRIFYKECKSLARMGHDVVLIEFGATEKKYIEDGVKVVVLKRRKEKRFGRIFCDSKKIVAHALEENGDIYHLHDPELLLYAKKIKRKKRKVIFDSHETYALQIKAKEYLPKFLRNMVSKLYYKVETHICKKIDGVITVGSFEGKNWFDGRSKKNTVIANYPIIEEFCDIVSQKQPNVLCYVGGITYERGITQLLEAIEDLDVQMLLAGPCEEHYLEQLKAMKSWRKVNYYGLVGREGVREILSKSSIGICALLNKGQYNQGNSFPVKVLEYMAAGLPVISARYPFAVETIEGQQCGLCIDPIKCEEYRDAIRFYLEQPKIARIHGENGRRLAAEKYNWQNEADKLNEFYKSMV